jgi:hypothetical protein
MTWHAFNVHAQHLAWWCWLGIGVVVGQLLYGGRR